MPVNEGISIIRIPAVYSSSFLLQASNCVNMDASQETASGRNESPDPASHSLNSYDAAEDEWVDEEDDDDGMDYEPTTDDSEDNIEFFETTEDDEEDGEYQGMGTEI